MTLVNSSFGGIILAYQGNFSPKSGILNIFFYIIFSVLTRNVSKRIRSSALVRQISRENRNKKLIQSRLLCESEQKTPTLETNSQSH